MSYNPNDEIFTRKLFRTLCEKVGYSASDITDEKAPRGDIAFLLENAKKNGDGGEGRPDFFITKENDNRLIIVEAKGDVKYHMSKFFPNPIDSDIKSFFENHNKQIVNYACDGIIWYMSFLSKQYNIIGIAISGQEDNYKIDTFYWGCKEKSYQNLNIHNIRSFDNYFDCVSNLKAKQKDLINFRKVASTLNEEMRSYVNLREEEKPLFVSAILLALKADREIKSKYNAIDEKTGAYKLLDNDIDETGLKDGDLSEKVLSNVLVKDVVGYLVDNGVRGNKIDALKSQFAFISGREEFRRVNSKLKMNPLRYFISYIDNNVAKYFQDSSFDCLGSFYNEFLHYGGGDGSGLGIALTPAHITNLFCSIANLSPTKSKVLDICTGTGGFLVAAMNDMIEKSNGDPDTIASIKAEQLIGIEMQPYMFALACSNMILRGDGKSNLYYSSCFNENLTNEIKNKNPNVGMINPPYSQGAGLEEWRFIKHMLSMLSYGGTGIAIIPISCFLKDRYSELRKEILAENTLVAVMSMPEQLFTIHGKNNVHTAICVFEAGKKHPENYQTWFGYWRDDGFEISGGKRIDKYNRWEAIEKEWSDMYNARSIIPTKSVFGCVEPDGDWTPENFLDIDYENISTVDFRNKYREFLVSRVQSLTLSELYNTSYEPIKDGDEVPLYIDWRKTHKFKILELFYPSVVGNKSIESKVAKSNMEKYLKEEYEADVKTCNFISAKNNSNGLCGKFVGNPEFEGNCLTVVKQGDGGKGVTFYQQDDFCTSNMVCVLRPRYEGFNEYIGIFIATLLQMHKYRFSFGRPVKEELLDNITIKLPYIIKDNVVCPDYEYIEKYMKTLLTERSNANISLDDCFDLISSDVVGAIKTLTPEQMTLSMVRKIEKNCNASLNQNYIANISNSVQMMYDTMLPMMGAMVVMSNPIVVQAINNIQQSFGRFRTLRNVDNIEIVVDDVCEEANASMRTLLTVSQEIANGRNS